MSVDTRNKYPVLFVGSGRELNLFNNLKDIDSEQTLNFREAIYRLILLVSLTILATINSMKTSKRKIIFKVFFI